MPEKNLKNLRTFSSYDQPKKLYHDPLLVRPNGVISGPPKIELLGGECTRKKDKTEKPIKNSYFEP